jgi:hypothetical protein
MIEQFYPSRVGRFERFAGIGHVDLGPPPRAACPGPQSPTGHRQQLQIRWHCSNTLPQKVRMPVAASSWYAYCAAAN